MEVPGFGLAILGTDHESFDALGIPGFQLIQEAIEHMTRTRHSNQDLYERIHPAVRNILTRGAYSKTHGGD